METRLRVHKKLLRTCDNVYFQTPSNKVMIYPCIVYTYKPPNIEYANNKPYLVNESYDVVVIDRNVLSDIPNKVKQEFIFNREGTRYVKDGLNHTPITIFETNKEEI